MKIRKAGSKDVLNYSLSEPLNGARSAQVNIHSDTANIEIDSLTRGEHLLASGRLQYFENLGQPTRTLNSSDGQSVLDLIGGATDRPWFRLPWAACNGALEWQIQLNPAVSYAITTRSGGGNVRLNLAGTLITSVSADTGGGNVVVVLPDNSADLSVLAQTGGGNVTVEIGSGVQGAGTVTANSGAGNVTVQIPAGIEAKIHASSGLGKVIIDSRFNRMDSITYQSAGYDSAANKVEITAKTGAGNVSISTKI